MTTAALIHAFEVWSAEKRPLVLATVYDTEGSTYSKAGAQMLITGDTTFQGMLSGGCLEGDLAERARAVIETGVPQAVTYDLGKNDEELWGLGVGCDGLMRIFLQNLDPGRNYEPFGTMVRVLDSDRTEIAATVIQSGSGAWVPASTLVTVDGRVAFSDIGKAQAGYLDPMIEATLENQKSAIHEVGDADDSALVLVAALVPPPNIIILGAGLDAEPVLRYALELGWRVTVQDHRSAYLETGNFDGARKVHCVPADQIAQAADLDRFDAAVVMSHHLASDRAYLSQLARTDMSYIGLLGPPDRRCRLLEDLDDVGELLEGRVHGPAGLEIGGRGPAAIALSIVAEMHRALICPATD